MGDIQMSPAGAALANRIRTIDRELDGLEQAARESTIAGLHNSGAAMAANLVQTTADEKRERLVAERVDVVRQLKELVAATEKDVL